MRFSGEAPQEGPTSQAELEANLVLAKEIGEALSRSNAHKRAKTLRMLHFPSDPVPDQIRELMDMPKNPRYYDLKNLGIDQSTDRLLKLVKEIKRAIKNGTERMRRRLKKERKVTDEEREETKIYLDLLNLPEKLRGAVEQVKKQVDKMTSVPDMDAQHEVGVLHGEVLVLLYQLDLVDQELNKRSQGQKWLSGMDPDSPSQEEPEEEGPDTIPFPPR